MASYTFAEVFPAFARGSDAYAIGSNGLLQVFTGATPRFPYNPTATFIKGLLVEPATTNLNPNPQLTQSPTGTVTNWTASNLTASIAPSGQEGMTGRTGLTRITDSNISVTGALSRNSVAITADGSFYVFRVSFRAAPLLSGNTAEIPSFLVNMGPVTATIAWDPTISNDADLQANCKIAVGDTDYFGLIAEANGIYSAWMAFPDTGSTAYSFQIRAAHNSSTTEGVTNQSLLAATGGVQSGATGNVDIDWVQVEKRSVPYPSSWTLGTRNAEIAVVSGTKFTEFFPQDGTGVIACAAAAPDWEHGLADTDSGVVVSLNDGTVDNAVRISRRGQRAFARVVSGGVAQADIDLGSWPNGTVAKVALSYSTDSIIAAVNGNTAIVDTSATVPAVTQLVVGSSGVGTQHFGSEVGYVKFYLDAQDATTVKNLTI